MTIYDRFNRFMELFGSLSTSFLWLVFLKILDNFDFILKIFGLGCMEKFDNWNLNRKAISTVFKTLDIQSSFIDGYKSSPIDANRRYVVISIVYIYTKIWFLLALALVESWLFLEKLSIPKVVSSTQTFAESRLLVEIYLCPELRICCLVKYPI